MDYSLLTKQLHQQVTIFECIAASNVFSTHRSFLPLSSLKNIKDSIPNLSRYPESNLRTKDIFKLANVRTEKALEEFTFRARRDANRINKQTEGNSEAGLNKRTIVGMWKHVDEHYS